MYGGKNVYDVLEERKVFGCEWNREWCGKRWDMKLGDRKG